LHYSKKRKYCSNECASITKIKPRGWLKKAIRTSKKAIIQKQEVRGAWMAECGFCGSKKELTVDHVYKYEFLISDFLEIYDKGQGSEELLKIAMDHAPFWDKSNLRILCRKCNTNREMDFRRAKKQIKEFLTKIFETPKALSESTLG